MTRIFRKEALCQGKVSALLPDLAKAASDAGPPSSQCASGGSTDARGVGLRVWGLLGLALALNPRVPVLVL